jgi:4-hydroxybenzoate polyprenyltransferase
MKKMYRRQNMNLKKVKKRQQNLEKPLINIEGLFQGTWAPSKRNLTNLILGYFSLQRFLVAIMGPLMFLSGMFLALKAIPSTTHIVIGFLAVYLLTASEHTIDDFIDIDRDKIKWPDRALPNGLISRSHAGLYAIFMLSIGIILSYIIFNWQVVLIELVALGLGAAYPFLRDKVGYLTLPPVPALIGIAGWVSVSPETLFKSSVPWLLYLVFVGWQSFHILAMPWAIKYEKVLFVKLSPRNTALVSVIFSIITFIFIIPLFLEVKFHIIFLLIILLLSSLFWSAAFSMVKNPLNDKKTFRAFKIATSYNIFLCITIAVFSIWP